ncbi:MAG: hypothetical protein LUE65_09465 [Clostridiales bacterium]|nr:hypothetical protein [Clostridiales bacterium]
MTEREPWVKGNRERRGGEGRGHGGRFSIASLLDGKPEAMILFVGAVGCTRHRAVDIVALMRQGRMALLCPSAADFATGRYLVQIENAMAELKERKGVSEFVLMYGCQSAVLSTDFERIRQQAMEKDGIAVHVFDQCHLCRTDHDDEEECG